MFPLPADEDDRLSALHSLHILDTAAEERFDRITRMAQAVFHVPTALISLVDARRQWFKSCQGLDTRETPREMSFCTHAILQDGAFVIEDARQDARFSNNPLVTGPPRIRFYAGYPLSTRTGRKVGTLCLIDQQVRRLDESGLRQLHDLAAWAQTELQVLETQQAEREALIARLGHELRTPLTAVLGSLGLLQEDFAGPLPDHVARYVQMAVQSSRQLADTIERLLAAERLLAHQRPLQVAPVDMPAFIRQQADIWQERASRYSCRVLTGQCDNGSVETDRETLAAALGHLLDNACRFSPPGGTVTLSARRSGQGWQVAVADQGPGLSAEVQAQLFQPFAQPEAEQFGANGGSGLGLYLCQSLMATLHGHVTAHNGDPHGACFTLVLVDP